MHQDTVGPMCRSVSDAAILLTAIAGRDSRDPYTLTQPEIVPDYLKALNPDALRGVRFGVPRALCKKAKENITAAFVAAVDIIRGLGATVVDPADIPGTEEYLASVAHVENIVLMTDFKVRLIVRLGLLMRFLILNQVDIAKYLSELVEVPTGVRTLADLIAFNEANADKELIPPYWDSQSKYVESIHSSK